MRSHIEPSYEEWEKAKKWLDYCEAIYTNAHEKYPEDTEIVRSTKNKLKDARASYEKLFANL